MAHHDNSAVVRFGGLVGAFTLAVTLVLSLMVGTAPAFGSPVGARGGGVHLGFSRTPSQTEPSAVCPAASKGHAECMSIAVPSRAVVQAAQRRVAHRVAPALVPNYEGDGEGGGFSPGDLRSAYTLPETGGSGQTVAIVDAYNDPNAEADLKTYRSHYKLSECTKANGCFKKVNQAGETEPKEWPTNQPGWGEEISLDLDMVSAVCPECHILLVEATNNEDANLYAGVEEAVKLKATEVSNSWGGPEYNSEATNDSTFDHPGVPITAAAGDYGYEVSYPAASPYVISTGGTALAKDTGTRGWSEEAWVDTGGGCSRYESKPKWQASGGCSDRTDNDVAAVASPQTPVSVYDSYEHTGWILLGGTSVATPIIAGVEALSTSAFRSEGPEAFYKESSGARFDIAVGSDGYCVPPTLEEDSFEARYLCNAELGYDAPTGNGTVDFGLSKASSVVSGAARAVKGGEADLVGSVNPGGLETKYYFEYGVTKSYGEKSSEASAGSGSTSTEVSQLLTHLQVETTYYYRLVATNSGGTTYGEDHTFTTSFWTISPTPNYVKDENSGEVLGASCASSEACTIVGYAHTELGRQYPMAERWNGTEWSFQKVPHTGSEEVGELRGVSCASSTSCTAVGWKATFGVSSTVADYWNGTEWTAQTTPTDEEEGEELNGVSCTASTACTAVGIGSVGTGHRAMVAQRWNGTEWKAQSILQESGEESGLSAVSCYSSAGCTAVGWQGTSKETLLVEHWNGTAWAVQSAPGPAGAKESHLLGVSCPSSTSCMAVGYDEAVAGVETPFTELWNGTSWTLEKPEVPSEAGSNLNELVSFTELLGVSCVSASVCTATGAYTIAETADVGALTEFWNGKKWTIERSANAVSSGANILAGVSCTTSEFCVAAGSYSHEERLGEGPPENLVDSATFNAPRVETDAATTVGAVQAKLNGLVLPGEVATKYYFEYGTTTSYGTKTVEVSAGSGTGGVEAGTTITALSPSTTYHFRIVATNSDGSAYGADQTFTTASTAPWAIQETLNRKKYGNTFSGVSCTSASFCAAVGRGENEFLTEEWNGSAWAYSKQNGFYGPALASVSCTAKAACVSVGINSLDDLIAGLWNGTEWSYKSMPAPPEKKEESVAISSISCASAEACTAVGWYTTKSGSVLTLAERWNGKEWSIQTIANEEGKENRLERVSCPSTTACLAVGHTGSTVAPLVEQWNGKTWSLTTKMATPKGGTGVQSEAVYCSAAEECTVVGHYSVYPEQRVLAERWNGKEWSVEEIPTPEGAQIEVVGISCPSKEACTAVGRYDNMANPRQVVALAEHWNSKTWTLEETPDRPNEGNELVSVSCWAAEACTAVGDSYVNISERSTLAQRFS